MPLETRLPENRQIPRTPRLHCPTRELILLAPSGCPVPKFFSHLQVDPSRHRNLLAEMQTIRAKVYLEEGAITPGQLTGRRHQQESDARSWHLLVLDSERHVCGCARYVEYPRDADFSRLGVAKSALARCAQWGARLASAVEAERALVRRLGLSYVELGGWALLDEIRGTTEALRMVLTVYSLAQALGSGVGISTATRRNSSASILRRIGARPLEHENSELPSYHDPQYRCAMEILRFYFWDPNPRYAARIAEIKAELPGIRVITDRLAEPGRDLMKTKPTFNSDVRWSRQELRNPATAVHYCVPQAPPPNAGAVAVHLP
jgi:hypothetical protein